jgi:serine protease Do
MPVDSQAKLTVLRDSKKQDIDVTIGEQPEDTLSRASRSNGQDPEAAAAENLGITVVTPNDQLQKKYGIGDAQGALVNAVVPGSPAAQAGIRPGDCITRISDKPITSAKEASDMLSQADLNKGVRLYLTNKEGERLVFVKAR